MYFFLISSIRKTMNPMGLAHVHHTRAHLFFSLALSHSSHIVLAIQFSVYLCSMFFILLPIFIIMYLLCICCIFCLLTFCCYCCCVLFPMYSINLIYHLLICWYSKKNKTESNKLIQIFHFEIIMFQQKNKFLFFCMVSPSYYLEMGFYHFTQFANSLKILYNSVYSLNMQIHINVEWLKIYI